VSLLASEWTKLRSVASTWWCTAIYLLVALSLGWLAAASTDRAPSAAIAVSGALTGFGFAQLVLVVLGVLAGAGEFSTGMAVASFTAVPRRWRLLVAKTVVVAGWCALLTVVAAAGCGLAARTLTAVPGGVSLAAPDVLRQLLLQVAWAALVAVLGVALGTLLRSSAGGIGLGMALVFVLPPLLSLAGSRWAERLAQALPALRVGEEAFLAAGTSWPVGLAVVGGWALVSWAGASVLLERRDV
jgi:ABC-type transport system involved in multi-copper enzyme maturation permease subunit